MRFLPSPSLPGMALQVAVVLFASYARAQAPEIPPAELVRRAVQNETSPDRNPMKFMFRDDKKTPRGTQSRLIVETNQAMVGMTLANDGRPLSPAELEAERQRVQRFLDDPDELRKKQTKEKEDEEHTTRIVKALPDAFVYQYGEATVGGKGVGKPGDPLVRLNFHPKPDYQPPTHVEQVLAGMQGYLLIDTNANRIAKIDGTLMKEVGFGWGILGHLDKGGHFLVEQGEAGHGQWEVTRMGLSFTGKVLFFKGLNFQSEEIFSDFQPVARDLSFAQGVELVKKEAEKQRLSCQSMPCRSEGR